MLYIRKELLFCGTILAGFAIWGDLKNRIVSEESTAVFEPLKLIKNFDPGLLKTDCSFIIYSYKLID